MKITMMQKIKVSNLDKKPKLYYNIYIKKINKLIISQLDDLTKIKKIKKFFIKLVNKTIQLTIGEANPL